MEGPRPARGHRVSAEPQLGDQGERGGLPAAPLLHGRSRQDEDAAAWRHPAPGGAPQPRHPRDSQERVRSTQVIL